MPLLALHVGRPREIVWEGRPVTTSIFKSAVTDRRRVSLLNVDGDEQSDLRVHGGRDKAVYAYDQSHYDHWRTELDRDDWPTGLFGENLTTQGLPDYEVRIGNQYRIGTVLLQAVQPRFPCYKLNARFGRPDMMERMMANGRHGVYFRVLEEGELQAGDAVVLEERSPYNVTVADAAACLTTKGGDQAVLRELLEVPCFPERMKETFRKFLR